MKQVLLFCTALFTFNFASAQNYTYSPTTEVCGTSNGDLIKIQVISQSGSNFTFRVKPTNNSCGDAGAFGNIGTGTAYIFQGIPSTENTPIASESYNGADSFTDVSVNIGTLSVATSYYAAIIDNCNSGYCYAGPITITPVAPTTGDVSVNIMPTQANLAGAQWRINGFSPAWYNDDQTVTGVPAGSYSIEFKTIPDWITPDNVAFNLAIGELENINGTYIQNTTYSISGQVTDGLTGAGVNDVTVTFASAYTATTNSSGFYIISDIPAGTNGTITPALNGYFFQPSGLPVVGIYANLYDKNFQTQTPQISASTGHLSFGEVFLGTTANQSFVITNTGNYTLNVSSIFTPAGFSIAATGFTSGTIAPGGSRTVDVQFSPVSTTTYSGTLYISSDAVNYSSYPIAISGQGVFNPDPAITLTDPTGGEQVSGGSSYTINWTSNNISNFVSILFFDGSSWSQIASEVPNTGSYIWEVPDVVSNITNAKIAIRDNADPTVDAESGVFTILAPVAGNCSYSDVDNFTPWASEAATLLCNESILDDDGIAAPTELLNRAELAKMVYLAIGLDQNPVADNFPSPFNDLQDPNIWYYSYAKNLTYLEYGDCTAAFDKSFFNFKPSDPIENRFVLKVLYEAWNQALSSGAVPYNLNPGEPMADYIYTAHTAGILDEIGDDNYSFDPYNYTTRAEVFVMIYNMIGTYTVPVVSVADFYEPGNYTPATFSNANSLHSGNFNFYTKTSFSISSIGLPLVFGHTYNSYIRDLPNEFYAMQPLGNGWSHSYLSYAMEITGDTYATTNDDRIVVMLSSGKFNVFKKESNGLYTSETNGVYAELTKPGPAVFQLTTRYQLVYTFQKLAGSASDFPFVLTAIKDRNNNQILLVYENANVPGEKRLKEVIGTAGRKLLFSYHSNSDRIYTVTDPLNRMIQYNFGLSMDGTYNLNIFTNAKNNNTIYTYSNTNCDKYLLKSITLPKGNAISNTYEDRKLKSTKTNNTAPTILTYDRNYNNQVGIYTQLTASNTVSGTSITAFDSNGNITSVNTPAYDAQISYGHSCSQNMNKPSAVTINTLTSSYTYDCKGNLLQLNLPEGVSHAFSYNDFNDLKSYTNPNGKNYSYTYDGNGNVISATTPRSTTNFTRSNNGLLTALSNPEGITVTFGHDTYGNVIQTTSPTNIQASAVYDTAGRMTSITNPNGQTTSYTYDHNDNILSNSFSGTTSYSYDNNDNLLDVTNANGGTTLLNYEFDTDFLLSSSFDAANDVYTYLDDGRIQTHTNPDGVTFTYAYDAQKRLETISSSDGTVTVSYDNRNNIQSVISTQGMAMNLAYDNLNRVTSVSYDNQTVGYTYDDVGNVLTITYPNNKTVNYTYYDDNLLQSVTDWNNKSTGYTYRDDGLLLAISNPNGTTCTYTYDEAGRNTGQSWQKSDGTIINSYIRAFDPFGNIISVTSDESLAAAPPPNTTVNYNYDTGNQIQNAGSTSFSFNNNGTTSTKENNTYTFDNYEQLIAISGTTNATYSYDAMGHRRQKNINGNITKCVLDILGIGNTLLETDNNNNPLYYYIYGNGLISRINPAGEYHYYHTDYRGSIIAMTDDAENITHEYAYGPYGELWASNEADFNPFRYAGGHGVQYDGDSIYFMRARYYDAEIGRFLSEDPIWHTNLYNYADGNPVNRIDPEGKISRESALASVKNFGKSAYNIGDVVFTGVKAGGYIAIRQYTKAASAGISAGDKLNDASKNFTAGYQNLHFNNPAIKGENIQGLMDVTVYQDEYIKKAVMLNNFADSVGSLTDLIEDPSILKDLGNLRTYIEYNEVLTPETMVEAMDLASKIHGKIEAYLKGAGHTKESIQQYLSK